MEKATANAVVELPGRPGRLVPGHDIDCEHHAKKATRECFACLQDRLF
jgi:hypothetical protein